MKFLFVVVSLLLLSGILSALFTLDSEVFRWLLLLFIFVFSGIFLRQVYTKDVWFLAALGLFMILNICLMNYEIPVFRRSFYITGILGYSFLIFRVWPEIKDFKSCLLQKILVGFTFLLDGALVLFLQGMISEKFDDVLVEYLFLTYGLLIVLLMIAALYFNDRYANSTSFFFLISILGLILSDVTLFIAYYMGFYEFYLPSCIFYFLGIAGLFRFSSLSKKESATSTLQEDVVNYF